MLYNLVNLPFKNVFHNYRSNIIHISFFVILMAGNYYRSMKSTTPLPEKARIYAPAILVLVCMGISVVISLMGLIYEGIKWIMILRKNEGKRAINPREDSLQTIRPDLRTRKSSSTV